MQVWPVAMNSLGEMICLGCGRHFRDFTVRRGGQPKNYCKPYCKLRVERMGGRLTRADVAERIAALGPL
jgi:hypothetical protein